MNNRMTIQEYIERDYPFYHVTKMALLSSIIENGLEARRCNAICVVRNCDRDILYEIIRQVRKNVYDTFAIIRIIPSMFGIDADMICEDSVDDITAPLHNYILVDRILIREEDVILKDYVPVESDCQLDTSKVVSLEGYSQPKRPFINDDFLVIDE